MVKKLLILSCNFVAASTFAMGREVKEEIKTTQEPIIFEHNISFAERFYHQSQMLQMPAPTKEPFFQDQNFQVRIRTMKTSFDVDAMNTYNTHIFELYLQIRPTREKQN